jgi:hypothetical protein
MPAGATIVGRRHIEDIVSDGPSEQPVSGAEAARLLGLCATSSLNRTRRRLERYLACHNGAEPQLNPVPAFASERDYQAFARQHILVVPEWGGRRVFGGDWRYLPSLCRSWSRLTRYGDVGGE